MPLLRLGPLAAGEVRAQTTEKYNLLNQSLYVFRLPLERTSKLAKITLGFCSAVSLMMEFTFGARVGLRKVFRTPRPAQTPNRPA